MTGYLILVLVIVVLLTAVAVTVMWLRGAVLKERIGVLTSRVNALHADKAMLQATTQSLRERLSAERGEHSAAIEAERAAAQEAAAKSGKLTTLIADGQHAEALDEALRGL